MNLSQWLVYLENLHPEEIELGLDRIRQVAKGLALDFSNKKVISVAGTNGKGSTISMLGSILRSAGYRVGSYTSPHLVHYNERVCINNTPVSDQSLCDTFALVEEVRGDIELTYFEFGTLAALVLFSQQQLDYVLLEVGLGGRLDAVNILDADLSILTNVALDHMDWLGDTREAIGKEKAGIFRAQKPAIYGESDIPETVLEQAESIGAIFYRKSEQFNWCYDEKSEDSPDSWSWQGTYNDGSPRELKNLPLNGFNLKYSLDNAALVLEAVTLLDRTIDEAKIIAGLQSATLSGRFQCIDKDHTLVLDVAHNPHATENLVKNLKENFPGRAIKVVIAMLADKDIEAVLELLKPVAEKWYVGEISASRGSPAKLIYNHLQEGSEIDSFDTIKAAYKAADSEAGADDVVLVTGSFYTVAAVLELI